MARLQKFLQGKWSRDIRLGEPDETDRYTQRTKLSLSKVSIVYDLKSHRRTFVCSEQENLADYLLRYTSKGWLAYGPTREELFQLAEEERAPQVSKSEAALLRSAHQELVHIPAVQMALSPLRAILIFVDHFGSVTTRQLVGMGKSREQVGRYVSLLNQLGYTKPEGESLVKGPRFSGEARSREPIDLYDEMLSTVAKESYSFLSQVLRFTQMVGYMRWANAYYLTALAPEENIVIQKAAFEGKYQDYYGRFKRGELYKEAQIQRVVDTGLIRWENEGVTGNEDISSRYFKEAKVMSLMAQA